MASGSGNLATMGPAGLRAICEQNILKTGYAATEIGQRTKHRVLFSAPRFNEFVVELNGGRSSAGLPLSRFFPELGNSVLLCVTETARRKAIDAMVSRLGHDHAN